MDYVPEHPDYVRGVLTSSIQDYARESTFCHHCGYEQVTTETCHVRCPKCGQISEGCGD